MGDICSSCGQRIPHYEVALSKNLVNALWGIFRITEKRQYFKSHEARLLGGRASPTSNLTFLRYFGAIDRVYTPQDIEKRSKRSGKYALTKEGLFFLKKEAKLPSYVIVKNKVVIEKGPMIFIDDSSLQWKTEDDIWIQMQEFWDSKKRDPEVQTNLFNKWG